MEDLQELRNKGHTNREISEITGLTYHQVVEKFRRPRKGRRKVLKRKAVGYLGGKCQYCGYDKCVDCFDFHHRDPLTKQFTVNKFIRDIGTWAKLKTELDSCILLCCICHREAHAGLIDISNL